MIWPYLTVTSEAAVNISVPNGRLANLLLNLILQVIALFLILYTMLSLFLWLFRDSSMLSNSNMFLPFRILNGKFVLVLIVNRYPSKNDFFLQVQFNERFEFEPPKRSYIPFLTHQRPPGRSLHVSFIFLLAIS